MNKIIVIGHLGRDPEMRYTPNGQGGSRGRFIDGQHWGDGGQQAVVARSSG